MLTWFAIALGALAVIALLVLVAGPFLSRHRLLRQHLRDRFMVTLKTGETFTGLLKAHDAGHLIFEDAKALVEGRWTPADGHLFVPRPGIAYMQRPTDQSSIQSGDAS